MDYCEICHDTPCELPDNPKHQAIIALSKAIEQDRESHIFPGFGIVADCATDLVRTLNDLGFEIKRIDSVH